MALLLVIYPVIALYRGDPTALNLQDWLLPAPQQFLNGVSRLKALDLGLGGS